MALATQIDPRESELLASGIMPKLGAECCKNLLAGFAVEWVIKSIRKLGATAEPGMLLKGQIFGFNSSALNLDLNPSQNHNHNHSLGPAF